MEAESTLHVSHGFFYLSLFSLALTASANIRIKNLGPLVIPWFFLAWIGGELAWFHIAWESVVVIWQLLFGDLSHASAKLALLIMLGCIVMQWRFHQRAKNTGEHFQRVFEQCLGMDYRSNISALRQSLLMNATNNMEWLKPFSMRRPGVKKLRDIRYGEHPRHILDIYKPEDGFDKPCPVLLQIHGGAWIIGSKDQQALPLMNLLASRGWLCVAINYRLGPKDRMPALIEDAKKALAWTKEHIAEYGGDPDFIAVTGESAGGHLSSLLSLTPDVKEWQPGFEEADTRVQACVPIYGIYDFMDRNGVRGKVQMTDFLAQYVMPCKLEDDRELWDKSSPLGQVNADAPPFLVIHGTHDSMAFVEEARAFVTALRAVAKNPVLYAELDQAQHAFEIFHSVRCEYTIAAIQLFLEHCYANHLRGLAHTSTSAPSTKKDHRAA